MTIVAINSNYPCCARHAHFTNGQADKNLLERMCRHCHRWWWITRTKGDYINDVRMDYLEWKEVTK